MDGLQEPLIKQIRRLSASFSVDNHSKLSTVGEPTFADLILNSANRSKLANFRFDILNWFPKEVSANRNLKRISELKEKLRAIVSNIEAWHLTRRRQFIKYLKFGSEEYRPNEGLSNVIDGLHWCYLSQSAAETGIENEEADEELWWRFAVDFQGKKGAKPGKLDPEYMDAMYDLRNEALSHFQTLMAEILDQMPIEKLTTCLYYITKYSTGDSLMSYLLPMVQSKTTMFLFESEVIPKFLILCALKTDASGAKMTEYLISNVNCNFSVDAINAAFVISAFSADHSTFNYYLTGQLKKLLTTEGIINALIILCARGHDHKFVLAELFVVQKIQTSQMMTKEGIQMSEEMSDWTTFIAPFIYVWIALTVNGGSSKYKALEEMIDFYTSPFSSLLTPLVTTNQHKLFIECAFLMACDQNQPSLVSTLLKAQWSPSDITDALMHVTELGHQKMVAVLLESLLEPDTKLKTVAGALPIIFRKSSILRCLPLVARRFPLEVANFLEGLSYIPVPLYVPVNTETDPFCKTKTVNGIWLGSGTLEEVLQLPDADVSADFLWNRLKFEGQLRKASANTSNEEYENESIICMVPMALISEGALRDSENDKSSKSTNSLIRLLAINDDRIILQPVVLALVEYHWRNGGFWGRFALQFSVLLLFLGSMVYVFILISHQQIQETIVKSSVLVPVSVITIILSSILVIQEIRQMNDDFWDYIHSYGNMLDIMVHTISFFSIISGGFLEHHVPPLIMCLAILIGSARLLSHLGVFPSVGPLIRIWVKASVNVFPILIPTGIMMLAFSFAFFIIEIGYETIHFSTIWLSIQNSLTMSVWDYTVLDNAPVVEIFILRVLFHSTFIVFFVNIIVALMTVNVAAIYSNTFDAWLIEIAGIMVELEIYWPYPSSYHIENKIDSINKIQKPLNRKGSIFPDWTLSTKRDIEAPEVKHNTLQKEIADSKVIFYTVRRDLASETSWWNNYSRSTNRQVSVERSPATKRSPNNNNTNAHNSSQKATALWNKLLSNVQVLTANPDLKAEYITEKLPTLTKNKSISIAKDQKKPLVGKNLDFLKMAAQAKKIHRASISKEQSSKEIPNEKLKNILKEKSNDPWLSTVQNAAALRNPERKPSFSADAGEKFDILYEMVLSQTSVLTNLTAQIKSLTAEAKNKEYHTGGSSSFQNEPIAELDDAEYLDEPELNESFDIFNPTE